MSRPHSAPDAFRAIADPTRRRMLDLLRTGERTVTELTQPFRIGMTAISQHLTVLRHARLVTQRRVGTKRLYRLDATRLRDAQSWLARFQSSASATRAVNAASEHSTKTKPQHSSTRAVR